MPDWSYHTLFQPLLLRLPVALARSIALGGIGSLAKRPGGGRVIDFFGHMAPDTALGFEKGGLKFPSRVGLGHLLDPTGSALAALARFGFGCIEVGPLEIQAESDRLEGTFDILQRRVVSRAGTPAVCWGTLLARLKSRPRSGPPVLLRLSLEQIESPLLDVDSVWLDLLIPLVDGVVLDPRSMGEERDYLSESLRIIPKNAGSTPRLWRLTGIRSLTPSVLAALQAGQLQGVLVDEEGTTDILVRRGSSSAGDDGRGRPSYEATLTDLIRQVRVQIGPDVLLIARGHVIDPQDYLDLRDAGADLVLIDDGLVFSGPGLSKRINEAELARIPIPPTPIDPRRGPESWVWTLLLGIALFGGGCLALLIALTRVILPYDEAFVGMNREQLCGVNDRLVDFMSHDRVTLAGTMIALGLCYSMLSIFGSRQGRHWAQVAIIASSFVGFFSFFAFLGYGYFDPFHAFVAAILFQFLLFGLAAPLSPVHDRVTPTLREDHPWRLAQWGQLLLIGHAVALCTAGVVILGVGSTSVFVTEDLEFMSTTAATLTQANPRIIPLIAHDRASFGGMLLSSGVATLLPILWGFERARPWLWRMLAGAGVAGYLCAISVHFAVGYTSSWHLAPAFGGALVLAVGLGLSKPYLCERPAASRRFP